MARDKDRRIAEVVEREGSRLRRFIHRRVPDPGDAEDVLQDVFHALVEANRLVMPIEHVTGWLFRVARNRIALRPQGAPRRDRAGDRGAPGGAARGVRGPRARGAQLQGDGRRHRGERQHAALPQALRDPAPAQACIAPLAILGVAAFVALGGWVVQLLWNGLLPALFGWRAVTFWQALGLLVLCRILFGGLGFRGGPGSSVRRRVTERWEHMTPEERERFRQGLRSRWGFGPPTGESKSE